MNKINNLLIKIINFLKSFFKSKDLRKQNNNKSEKKDSDKTDDIYPLW